MLTDIFANRYQNRLIWDAYTDTEARLLMQAFRIVGEQVMPRSIDGKPSETTKRKWKTVHDRLSMELGVDDLAPRFSPYQTMYMGRQHTGAFENSIESICKTFVTTRLPAMGSADRYIKERLSFVELAFRQREEEIAAEISTPATGTAAALLRALRAQELALQGKAAVPDEAFAARIKQSFQSAVDELNERFRRAGVPLNYHNGFIQIESDEQIDAQIETPFWAVVSVPLWANVDIDMKEALDRRDSNERDPALYAAKALESTLKIISGHKGWTLGTEKGAHNFIDNLAAPRSGNFISAWERDALKAFFTSVRNPLGHGPGDQKMPELTAQQTDWAIETCMSWIRALINRM